MAHLTKIPKLGISNSNDLYESYLTTIPTCVKKKHYEYSCQPYSICLKPNRLFQTLNESQLQTAIASVNCLDMVEMPAQDSVQPHIVNPTHVAGGISFPQGPKACIAALAAKPLLTHSPKKSVSNSAAT